MKRKNYILTEVVNSGVGVFFFFLTAFFFLGGIFDLVLGNGDVQCKPKRTKRLFFFNTLFLLHPFSLQKRKNGWLESVKIALSILIEFLTIQTWRVKIYTLSTNQHPASILYFFCFCVFLLFFFCFPSKEIAPSRLSTISAIYQKNLIQLSIGMLTCLPL